MMNFLVIDQDKIGSQERSANDSHVVGESLNLVRGVLIHELTNWKIKYLFHVTLLEEFIEHGLHPLKEYVRSSHYFEMITNAKSDAQDQSAILHAICREVIAQLCFELSQKHKMFAHVSVKHAGNDQLPHVSLSFNWNVFEQISIISIEHYLKCSRQMMLFENQGVTVANSKWMLCTNDELICVPRMLIVVDQVCNEAGKNIIELKITLKVG